MSYTPVVSIWPGSSSFTTGSTPYGFYDTDASFQNDADKHARWCGIRLGHGIMDVELQDVHFYASFEEAVTVYSSEVNKYNIRDNLMGLSGMPTASLNLSGQYIPQSMNGIIQISKEYASEIGAGGTLKWYTGSIALTEGQQVYDFTDASKVTIEEGDFSTDSFTIRKIFHNMYPSLSSLVANDGGMSNTDSLLNQFGWQGMLPSDYTLMPLHYDLMQLQAIEMNEQIRKSAYGFQITDTRLRIFPVPTQDTTLYFHYTLNADILDNVLMGSGSGLITDYSNIPYNNLQYQYINDIGKNWIKQYTLAVSMETLGLIRSKYSAIPIPDNEVTLNGDALTTAGQAAKEALLTELRETLDSLSKQAQLERKQAETEALQNQMVKIPLKIYVK